MFPIRPRPCIFFIFYFSQQPAGLKRLGSTCMQCNSRSKRINGYDNSKWYFAVWNDLQVLRATEGWKAIFRDVLVPRGHCIKGTPLFFGSFPLLSGDLLRGRGVLSFHRQSSTRWATVASSIALPPLFLWIFWWICSWFFVSIYMSSSKSEYRWKIWTFPSLDLQWHSF